ncbi:hypothetical protein HYX03_03550 [Candidatus Woesearchaeota archaeon]|nr:hypothetical protein [Candidatus Woesearchaeota archaeon]
MGFIKKLDKKYKKFGLKTLIVHPPEWGFEKNSKNIIYALKKLNIRFPIIIDKNRRIIKKLKINFWPAQILMRDKKILYKHVEEGNYKKLENKILGLLKIKSNRIFKDEPNYSKFPTVYCGKRKLGKIKKSDKTLKFGIIYADNNWAQQQEYIKALKNSSSLAILTKGGITNFVAESLNNKPIYVKIGLNNKNIKTLSINKPRLYSIIKPKISSNEQNKLAIITDKNLAIYSFSFQ